MSDAQWEGLDHALGLEHREVTPDRVVIAWTVGPEHVQPFGIVHGGVYCAVNESAASFAAQAWLGADGLVVGVNNNTDFLRQARQGEHIVSVALPVHRGRTQQLWMVESHNEQGKLLARGQVRLARIDGTPPAEFLAMIGLEPQS